MKKTIRPAAKAAILVLTLALVSCASIGVGDVENDIADLYPAEAWNQKDSQLVAAQFVNELAANEIIRSFPENEGRKAEIAVSKIFNNSDESIDTGFFTAELLRKLQNRDNLETVASKQPSPGNVDAILNGDNLHVRFNGDFLITGVIDVVQDDSEDFKTYRAIARIIDHNADTVLTMIREVRKLLIPEEEPPL